VQTPSTTVQDLRIGDRVGLSLLADDLLVSATTD
jgi:hypothetical protein